MAKAKEPKGGAKVTNKAIHSRVSYLFQAAAYLESRKQPHPKAAGHEAAGKQSTDHHEKAETTTQDSLSSEASHGLGPGLHALPRKLLSDLRSVSLKAQIRLSPAMKHTICKRCSTMLVDGSTCFSEIENMSKGGRKPWADVLVRRCVSCGYERRIPATVEKQKRKPSRVAKERFTSSV